MARIGRAGFDPVAALGSAIERTLDSGPPAVAFSGGGRDSSLLLAVAALVCRRAGMEPPLPVTLCMPSAVAEADERKWQELMLEHLQIPHWHRIPIGGELDLVGPYARRHLVRDGLLFPANAHSVVPMLEAAGPRCLIVGLGGDELLTPQQWRTVPDLLGRRRGPQRRDVVRLAAGAGPQIDPGAARPSTPTDWTRWSGCAQRPSASWRAGPRGDSKSRCHGERRSGMWPPPRRDTSVSRHAASRAGDSHRVEAPLLDPGFVGALARAGGRGGWVDGPPR